VLSQLLVFLTCLTDARLETAQEHSESDEIQGRSERKSDDEEIVKQDCGDHADAGKKHEMAHGHPPREPAASRRLQFSLSPVDHLERKRRITRVSDSLASSDGTDDTAPLLDGDAPPFPGPLVVAALQLSGLP
jgi:hypothetical protein